MAGIPFWLQNVIGPSVRAGLIAAGSPTPGAVGTIRDAVGGMQAAEADQNQRFDRAAMMRRAALQEERAMQEMEMEREQNAALLEYRKAQKASAEAQRARAMAPQQKEDYLTFRKRSIADGVTDEDQIMSAWMKQPYRSGGKPQAPSEPKTPQQIAAQRIAQISRYQDEPELDPTGDREKEDWAFVERVNRANDPAPKPPAPPRPPATAEAALVVPIYQRITDLKKLGTPQAMAEADKLRKELRGIMASKKADRQPSTQLVWGDSEDGDGMQEAIVVPKGKTGATGIKRKPSASGKDASSLINQWLSGESTAPTSAKSTLTDAQRQELRKKYGNY